MELATSILLTVGFLRHGDCIRLYLIVIFMQRFLLCGCVREKKIAAIAALPLDRSQSNCNRRPHLFCVFIVQSVHERMFENTKSRMQLSHTIAAP